MTSISGFVNSLGKKTIRQAIQGSTAETRANAVQKIGREIRTAQMNAAEKAFAAKLMDRICADVSDLVRRALSVTCLLYTSPSPRDKRQSRMPSSA